PDRRRPDRRLHRALAARPGRPSRGAARRVAARLKLLAHGAEPRAAAGDARLLDRRAAAITRLPRSPVGLELELHPTTTPIGRRVVTESCPLSRNPRSQCVLDALRHARDLVGRELTCRSKRMYACKP